MSLPSNFGAPLQRRESAICHNRLFLRKPQGSLIPSLHRDPRRPRNTRGNAPKRL